MNDALFGSPGAAKGRSGAERSAQCAPDDVSVNILIVDDRADKLLALQAILEELGQNVISARSGDEALKHVLERDFAVILLDVNMPGMDGLETAALLRTRQKTAHTPIIFVTAYADEVHTARGYSLGAVDYIQAPIVPDILRSKVKVFVQLHRMTHEIQRQAAERVALAREQAARTAAEEATRRFSFLARLTDVLEQSMDPEARGKAFARFVVPFLGDLAALVLVDDRGRIRRTEIAWVDPRAPSETRSVSVKALLSPAFERAIQQPLASGRAEAFEPIRGLGGSLAFKKLGGAEEDTVDVGFSATRIASFPLRARGRTQGVLLVAFHPGRAFDSTDFSFGNDVTRRAAVLLDNALLYQEVRDADSRKNEFLAMLGHELRNPMAPIRYAVHILRKPKLEEAKRAWGLDVIDRQVKQLARLVDDLLDVSRITRGKIELKVESVDLARVVSAAVETSRPLIESLRHHLMLRVPSEPIWVQGDFARLTQVLANLLNNAAKYTEPGGRIWLDLERSGKDAVFRVRDSGIGIVPEDLGRIFELFAQIDRKAGAAQGGLGIGLTLVQRLVSLHGGHVEAFSAGADQGAEFVVRLPSLALAQIPSEAADSLLDSIQHPLLRVLVVDDNADSADTMLTSLRIEGHEADVVYDGESAIQRASEFRPDAVLLDIGLPGMSGLDVARVLRTRPETQHALLIALSGYGQAEDRQRSLEAGMDHHLTKPVDPGALNALFVSLRSARHQP